MERIEFAFIQRRNNVTNSSGVTGKGFVKGDPSINRKGRPKTFDALRESLSLHDSHVDKRIAESAQILANIVKPPARKSRRTE